MNYRFRDRALPTILHAWFRVAKRDLLRRRMRQRSQHRRKEARAEIFQVAQVASDARDHFGVFQAIRSLAPKCARARIQLRDDEGTLLSPAQAADHIASYISTLYSDDSAESVLRPPSACEWPFICEEFQWELARLPS